MDGRRKEAGTFLDEAAVLHENLSFDLTKLGK